jgi:hypothetical protein
MLVLFMVVSTGWLLRLHIWLDGRAGKQSARGMPPDAGRKASPSLAPADPAGQPPHADRHPLTFANHGILLNLRGVFIGL